MGFFTLLKFKMDLGSNSDGIREQAVKRMGVLREQGAFDSLVKVLRDASPVVRRAAVVALGQLADGRALEPLLAVLKTERSGIRKVIAQSLGQINNPGAAAPLAQLLKDKDSDTRTAAVASLVKLGAHSVEPLLNVLTEKEEYTRQAALRALGELKDARAQQALARMLNNHESDVHMVAAALSAMGWIPTDPSERIRFAFARGRFEETIADGKAAVAPLTEILRDKNAEYRKMAADVLGKIGDPTAGPALIPLLTDGHAEVREATALALGTMRATSAVAGLVAALRDDSSEMVAIACWALGQLGDASVVPPLAAIAVQGGDHRVRAAAIMALGQFDDPRTTEPLFIALRDKRYDVRKAAIDALVKIGNVILPSLESALTDSETHVRRAAVLAMRQLRDPESVWALMRSIHDEDPTVRRDVLGALGQLGDPQVIDGILGQLHDEDTEVRVAAAQALGEIGQARALAGLLPALKDSYITEAVLLALQRILEKDPHGILPEDLQNMLTLQPGSAADAAQKSNIAKINQLAQQELRQREAV
jgi:HEAT repeat protein